MKNQFRTALLIVGVCSTSLVFGQQNSNNERYDRDERDSRRDERRNDDRSDDRSSRRDERRDDRRMEDRFDERREFNQRNNEDRKYDNRYDDRDRGQQYDERDLSKAYDEGFDDGQRSKEIEEKKERRENYKNFTFGIYGGANSTRFEGETVAGDRLSGRLGYQLGFFVRGGGRIYGQIGAEYLTSSSDFYRAGDGSVTSPGDIIGNVDQKYLHIPALIGVKLAQSERGVSAVRLAVGAEYAAPLGVNNNAFNFQQGDFRAATINGVANLGFDAGPLMLGFMYHHGFADVIEGTTNTKRRIVSVNVGFKF
ncbi:hypothetical protein [Spirosoma utsteinense]|uniref:Outer membrane protein beta-barrel domain-containing protein n=1 Tax=Spirosoma utsteinense TaxID=2585773 RepID=A0ABR6W4A7_9BACT|nr:hypothetical protein [Spirosoma utsteinense]MBC3786380.1 hypothetical protein [Spirosoma utsteinense]MBC3791429.1 hypothetical protein [Spirosoma utsteinense]